MSTSTSSPRRVEREALRRVVFQEVGYRPHPGQAPVHASRARHRVMSAGRRIGKSTAGGRELLVEAYRTRFLLPGLVEAGKRREFWIVGPEYTDSEKEFRTLYDDLRRLQAPFDRPGTYNDPHAGDMQISLYGGRYLVTAKSAKHPERLVGEGLNGVVVAEAAKQRERTWTKFLRPMLADYRGWSLHTSTPEGKNWFYDLWMKGQSAEEPEWASWRLPSWRNDVIYPGGEGDEEILALRRDLNTETFNQEIAALFTEFAGRVFKEFDEEVHVKDLAYDPAWPVYAACDYGFTNPFVWLLIQVDPWGSVYIVDELYERGLTIDEAALEIQARGLCPPGMRSFYPDPASPGDSRILEEKLRLRAMRGTGGDLDTRLRSIRQALRVRNPHLPEGHPERQPGLMIARRCTNTIREMNDYRYPATASESGSSRPPQEKPLKKDDHAPEALGRFFIAHHRAEAGSARVSRADISG